MRLMITAALTASIVLAACGSDEDEAAVATTPATSADSDTTPATSADSDSTPADVGGDCIADAGAAFAPYSELPTELPAQFAPLSKAPEEGRKVAYIALGANPQDIAAGESVEEAAAVVGWTGETITFDGSVEDNVRAFDQAISNGNDMIISMTAQPAAIQQPLETAKSEGIIVVLGGSTTDPTEATGFAGAGLTLSMFEQYGEILGNWVLNDSKCNAHVAAFGFNAPVVDASGDAFVKTISDACPDCEVAYTPLDPGIVGTPAATQQVIAAVQADPEIKYLSFHVGPVSTGVLAALEQAGITGIKLIGFSPDDNILKGLQDGAWEMMIANSTPLAAWALFDAGLRVLDTGGPWITEEYPMAVVTPDNVPVDARTVDDVSYPIDFKDEFAALWQAG